MLEMHIGIAHNTAPDGSAAERAAFGQLEVSVEGKTLTGLLNRVAGDGTPEHSWGPFVPGYHLAEWFATHWWRLRWEPSRRWEPSGYLSHEEYAWNLSHRMADIGEGYIWPNITFNCDGHLCEVVSDRTIDRFAPIEYLGSETIHVSVEAWERAVDSYVSQVLSLLHDANLTGTDLESTWRELGEERSDADLTAFRRIEALLGFDVDEGNEADIEAMLDDAKELGADAVTELAAGAGKKRTSASDIRHMSDASGFDLNVMDGFRWSHGSSPDASQWGQIDAWRIGKKFAHSVRREAGLCDGPITDEELVNLAGTSCSAIEHGESSVPISWVYAPSGSRAQVVLRGRSRTGRRFDMARVIGDRVFGHTQCVSDEPLSPATRSYSYRQKAQRSFAAELLCPWHAIEGQFEHDSDPEDIHQVAAQFGVSELVVEHMLENQGNHV